MTLAIVDKDGGRAYCEGEHIDYRGRAHIVSSISEAKIVLKGASPISTTTTIIVDAHPRLKVVRVGINLRDIPEILTGKQVDIHLRSECWQCLED